MSPDPAHSERKYGFAPVVDPDVRVLILGSLPGSASLTTNQYYAHPRNLFWRLIGTVIDLPELPNLAYPDRLAAIGAAGVGLWDVFTSAVRKGSLDQSIRAPAPSELAGLTNRLPHLQAVAFNGRLAATKARAILEPSELRLIDLPSSSPAHAALGFADKLQQWLALKEFLAAPLNPAAPMDIGKP